MIWIGIVIATYLIGFGLTFLAVGITDKTNGWTYSYSYGFAMALLVMLVYANVC